MNDHSELPVLPVEAFEPPYYVAVFTTVRSQEQSGYAETNARMESLVRDIPGYLGMDHAQTPGGLGITVGYFRDAEALAEWQSHAEHRAAQRRGRAEWYQSYTLHVAKVERSSAYYAEGGVRQRPTAT
ncbi:MULTISPECIES: antibiotic biosynthesis monooxygenase family protein [unclassified Streptomyces]|uniref:antibiotic biosynthesis monooxygenase family protein n=1 Tax=unclassified Streptomyces TaxID=2593676 RepID=UPI0024B68205|nr:antibiotic biosynthesis monooxygenase [Streptomyces sp. KAU_LT]MDI9832658.1 antibiotic biosynthesis monooxygenase [Streptomyces sp. KAU_LT]